MSSLSFEVGARSAAAPATVFALLDDSETWPSWTPLEHCRIERRAGLDGLGEIRAFTTGKIVAREEIVAREPDRLLAYVLLSGIAVRDYRAEIELTPDGDGGTLIRWRASFRAKVPGSGRLYRGALRRATRTYAEGLAGAAEREG